MNLKLEACRSCTVQCAFEQEVDITLAKFREGMSTREPSSPGIILRARDNLSKNLQAANRRGCPASEIKKFERVALTIIAPSLAGTKSHGRLVNPTAATRPFKAAPSSAEHSLKQK